MKDVLISKKFGEKKRGAFTISERFCELLPHHFDHVESSKVSCIHELSKKYRKIIFITQAPNQYHRRVFPSPLVIKDLNHLINIREEYNYPFYNSCTNGFNYFVNSKSIKNFFPFITDVEPIEQKKGNLPCLGFYYRKDLNPDSFKYFCREIIGLLKDKVNIFTMGDMPHIWLDWFKEVENWKHTYNRKEFWENVTHYVFPKSAVFIDPFPNALLEAVQLNKQIILPEVPGRMHTDGIEDIETCIDFHRNINFSIDYNNSDQPIIFQNFRKWYEWLIENNYRYRFSKDKYRGFNEWFDKEVK